MSRNKIFIRILTALGAAGLLGASATYAQNAAPFSSVREARDYLAKNPTGPLAEEAFKIIVDGTLSSKYPEFSGDRRDRGNSIAIGPSGEVTSPLILGALRELVNGGATAGGPTGTPRPREVY